MNSLILSGIALLMITALPGAYFREQSYFPELWDAFSEAGVVQDENVKKAKKTPALVRMIQDAAEAVGLDDNQDLRQLLKEAGKLRGGSFGKLKSGAAKNAATKLGKEMNTTEELLIEEIQQLQKAEDSDEVKLAKLIKLKNKVKDAMSAFKFLGEGKIIFIPYKYKGEFALLRTQLRMHVDIAYQRR